MTVQKNQYKPNRVGFNYSLELKCGGVDLTANVVAVRIGNTLEAIWPQVIVQLDVSAKTIIEEDIYGQKTMELNIYASGEIKEIRDTQTYYLTYGQGDITLVNVPFNDYQQQDKQVINVACLCTYAINIMGSFVNYIMDENTDTDNIKSGLTPLGILGEVLKTSGFTNYLINDQGQNTTQINECVIPPMSLNQCIDYLDNRFLLYDSNVSALFKYCNKDGQLWVWNLVDIMKSEPICIVNMLDNDADAVNGKGQNSQQTDIIEDADDEKIYAHGTIKTVHHSNANVLTYGYTSTSVQKPLHMLYRLETFDLNDMIEDIKFHPNMRGRKRYYTDIQSTSPGYIGSLLGQAFKRMSRLKLTVIRNIPLSTFTNIGRVVDVRMGRMVQYQKYQGKYILDSSDMVFVKSGMNWDAYCDITLFRASQESTESQIG